MNWKAISELSSKPYSFIDAIVYLMCIMDEKGVFVKAGIRGPRGTRNVLTISDLTTMFGWSRARWYQFIEKAESIGIVELRDGSYRFKPDDEQIPIITPEIHSKKSKISAKVFYDQELKSERCTDDYRRFVAFLYGQNASKLVLEKVLKIEHQLSIDDFTKLKSLADEKGKRISDILLKMENTTKYTKGKRSLNLTIRNWLTDRWAK